MCRSVLLFIIQVLSVVMSASDVLFRVRGFTVNSITNQIVVGSIRDDAWIIPGMDVGTVITTIGSTPCSGLPLQRVCELLLERVDNGSSSSSSSSSSARSFHKITMTAPVSARQAKRSAAAAGLLLDETLWRDRGFRIKRNGNGRGSFPLENAIIVTAVNHSRQVPSHVVDGCIIERIGSHNCSGKALEDIYELLMIRQHQRCSRTLHGKQQIKICKTVYHPIMKHTTTRTNDCKSVYLPDKLKQSPTK